MSKLEKLNQIMENEQNARTLLNVIVADYGVRDILECAFFHLSETEQEKILDTTLKKVGNFA